MQLPNNERSHVDPPKIWDYLLNLEHPVGGSKVYEDARELNSQYIHVTVRSVYSTTYLAC